MFGYAAEPDVLLHQPWRECFFSPVTPNCPQHWLGMAHISESWEEARCCCYETGWLAPAILVGGLGKHRKVRCFGGLMPVLAEAAPHNHIWICDLIPIATQSTSNKHVEDLMHSTWEERAQPKSF